MPTQFDPHDRYLLGRDGDASGEQMRNNLASSRVAEDRAMTATLLSATDWAIIRASDPTSAAPVPQSIIGARQAIRDANAAREAWITNASRTIDDLVSMADCPPYPGD